MKTDSSCVVDWLMRFSADRIGSVATATSRHAILDALACIVAGASEHGTEKVRDWVVSAEGRADSAILGTSRRAPSALAALANATAAHALDLDDVAMTMIHPSAVLAPVVFALGERELASGREVLAAYVAGFEVMTRICRAINPEHYARGWHAMQTVGVIGAAAAAARLLGLERQETAHAIAISASSAGGLRANFGSMVKPLHGGQAAFHGVQAAELARRGFTGGSDILEGRNGFLQLFSTPDAAERLRAVFSPGLPLEIEESGVALKRFACCGAIHSALDSLQELRKTDGFELSHIVRIECRVNALTPGILTHSHARTGLEGKFSMEYSAAVMLLTGNAGLEQYSDDQASDPRLRELMRAVDVIVDESLPIDLATFATIVTIELRSGERLVRRKRAPHGYPSDPLTDTERHAKVAECCSRLGAHSTTRLIELVESLEAQDEVREIVTSLTPEPRLQAR